MRGFRSWAGRACVRWVQKTALPILLVFLMPAVAAAQSIPGALNLKALFAIVGRIHNIDPDLLEAIAEVESGGDPLRVSPKGALGLMQLMPDTAREFSVLDPFNPVANIIGAADFLGYLRERLANDRNLQGLPALLAAYNAGPSAVEKYGGIPPYADTHMYVRRVIEQYTSGLGAQAGVAPVLILGGPKPYVIRLGPESHTLQPEPVLITADGDGSMRDGSVVRDTRGDFLAAIGTGTAPWIRRAAVRNSSELPQHRAHRIGSGPIATQR